MQKILYLLLIVSFSSYGQTAAIKLKSNINNTKTAKHINIPKTRIFIIPPPNYEVGFRRMSLSQKNVSFNFDDITTSSFSDNIKYRTDKAFEDLGYSVIESKNLKVNGYPAIYHLLKSGKTTKLYDLLFGNENFVVSISVSVNEEGQAKSMNDEIIKILNSIYFSVDEKEHHYVNTCFTLKDSLSNFKQIDFKTAPKGVVYGYRINNPQYKIAEFNACIYVFEFDKAQADSNNIIRMIKKNVGEWVFKDTVTKLKQTTIGNGYEAYAVELTTKYKTQDFHFNYFFLENKNKFIVLQLTLTDVAIPDYFIKEFNKFVNTIKLK